MVNNQPEAMKETLYSHFFQKFIKNVDPDLLIHFWWTRQADIEKGKKISENTLVIIENRDGTKRYSGNQLARFLQRVTLLRKLPMKN